ncbi:MAG TPA: hypothetical protein VEQ59_14400 [Polyangiaceae bacterium]|nr:hypothetical protein [Polyangiaceae bacterium]
MGRFWLVALLGVVGCGSSDKDSSPQAAAGSAAAGAAAAGSAGKTSGGGSATGAAGDTSGDAGEAPSGGRDRGGSSSGGGSGSGGSDTGSGGTTNGPGWVSTLISLPEAPRVDLNISQTTADKVSFTYSVYAKFAIMREQWDGCTKHQLADCWYYECPSGSYPVGTADDKPQTAGGSVTVENERLIETLALASDHYTGQGTDAFWPLTGDTIYFENHGSKPLFRLEAQSPPTVWLKTLNGQSPDQLTMLDRGQGAKLTWEAEGEGTAFFSIYSYTGVNVAAVCTFDAAAGSGTLPAAVLGHLDPGSEYHLTMRGDRRASTTADGFAIEATLYGYGRDDRKATFVLQ